MSRATLAVIHCQSDYKAEQGKVKLSNKAKREREKVVPRRSRSVCLPGQAGRQCCSYALATLRRCCPGSGLKVCHLGHGGDGEVHLCRIWRCGCRRETGQSRTNQGRALAGNCLGKFHISCFWRSGADMGVSWAGGRLPLLGSGSVIQILLSGCLPQARHDVPDSKAGA